MRLLLGAATAFVAFATSAMAAPVDLSTWSVEQGPGAQVAGNWVLAPDNNSVTQTQNSQVSVFYDGAASSQGKALSGTIKINSNNDNDFVGFVLGMDTGEVDGGAASVDYWLVDWKQANQSYVGELGKIGLSLSHVTGSTTSEGDFWGHTGVVSEKDRGATLGSTGWVVDQEYEFELIFTANTIQVFVDGTEELSWTAAQNGGGFLDGGFGFYNYSQADVTYAGIEEDPAPQVPLPAGMPLMLAGLGLLGFVRAKRAR